MSTPNDSFPPSSHLSAANALSNVESNLREAQESLANQLIERRLDQERTATLRLQIQELTEQVTALRRALASASAAKPGQQRPGAPVRKRRRG